MKALVGLLICLSVPIVIIAAGHFAVTRALDTSGYPTSTPPLPEMVDVPRWSKNWCEYCEGQTVWTDGGKARCQTCGEERERND